MAASVYVRMFGNELGFEHMTRNEMMNLKNKYNFKSIVSNLAKGEDISFTKSALFMDSSVAVPTIAGLYVVCKWLLHDVFVLTVHSLAHRHVLCSLNSFSLFCAYMDFREHIPFDVQEKSMGH